MKIFTNKGVFKKLLIVIVAILLFSAVVPTKVSYAANDTGGPLLKPIVDLLLACGDFVMDLIHKVVYAMDSAIVRIDLDSGVWQFIAITAAVIAAIVFVAAIGAGIVAAGAAILAKLGIALSAATIVTATAGTIITASIVGGVAAGMYVESGYFSNEMVLPLYKVTPEEIFRGEIPLLDINFFNPKPETTKEEVVMVSEKIEKQDKWIYETDSGVGEVDSEMESSFSSHNYPGSKYDVYDATSPNGKGLKHIFDKINEKFGTELIPYKKQASGWRFSGYFSSENETEYDADYNTIYITKINGTFSIFDDKDEQTFFVTYNQEAKRYESGADETWTTELIIDISKSGTVNVPKIENIPLKSLANQLQGTVASWYYAVRSFVLVVMMIVLLYIGIRIMLCGIASEKVKYKNMLLDWVVAICLVFVMHYIMAFSMNIVDGITKIFGSVDNDNKYVICYKYEEKLKDALNENDIDVTPILDKDTNTISWETNNIVGMTRVQAAMNNSGTYLYIGYVICFLVLVCYTVFFFYTYLKRALYLTFFTIMAPLVAMTYPIDKMHDGKAQAFNMWLKEYIFNLMIQPMHLLLYTVLITSAFELASTNILYTLVAIGFMMPAEKFIRKMFGFDKAQTPGFLSGAAGAALMVTGFNKLFHRKPSKGGGNAISDGEKSKKEEKINMKDDNMVDPFLLSQKSKAKENENISNVLSTQEKQRKNDEIKLKMEEAKESAQSFKPGEIDLNNRKSSNKSGFDMSEKVREDLQERSKKLNKSQEKKKVKGGKWEGIKAASKLYAKQKLKRAATNMAMGKPIKDIARVAGGLYLGAGGALLGATFGIAGGEMKNVTQYGATLGAAGYALGARNIKSDGDLGMAYEEYERAKYGNEEEYRKYLLEEQRKAVTENEKYLNQLRTYLKLNDLNEAKDYMQKYGDCIDAGVTDMEDLATIIKVVEQQHWDRDMAITASKYYKKAGGKPKNMNKRDRENIEYQYKNIVKSNGITDEKEVEETVKIMLKNLDTYGKIKDDLTQV